MELVKNAAEAPPLPTHVERVDHIALIHVQHRALLAQQALGAAQAAFCAAEARLELAQRAADETAQLCTQAEQQFREKHAMTERDLIASDGTIRRQPCP